MRKGTVLGLSPAVLALGLGFAPSMLHAGLALQCDTQVPAAAQDAFRRGQLAMQKPAPRWNVAIKHLGEALASAPSSPAVYCNLAVAHAEAGNEVPARVYLGAYREAAVEAGGPHKISRELVTEKSRELEVKIETKADRFLAGAVEVLDRLPDTDKPRIAQAVVLHMLAGFQQGWAYKVARRYPTGMTNAIVEAALQRKKKREQWQPVDAVEAMMLSVAEELAMIDPLDKDLTAPSLLPSSPSCKPLPFHIRDPDQFHAQLEKDRIECERLKAEDRERARPRWRKSCHGTRLMSLGIAQAEIGLPVTGLKTYLRGQKILMDLGKYRRGDQEYWEIHGYCGTPTIAAYVTNDSGSEPSFYNVSGLFRAISEPDEIGFFTASGPYYSSIVYQASRGWWRRVDLVADPAFVQYEDLHKDLWARSSVAGEVATGLAELGSKYSMAMSIFRGAKWSRTNSTPR